MWFFAILVVLALGGVALVAAGRGAPLAEVYDDRPDSSVPADGSAERPTTCAGCASRSAFRGYRMSEVDALLDRLARASASRRPTEPRGRPPSRRVATSLRSRAHFAPCRPR